MPNPPMNLTQVFIRDFAASLSEDAAAIFVGAGVSMSAGYPSWKHLLRDIGAELGVKAGDVADLAALAQWHIGSTGGASGIRQVIRNEIGVEKPVPAALQVVARLPVRHIWTTNYDTLIERAFSQLNRPLDPISVAKDLSLKPRPGATRLYKMHGTVQNLSDLVISTDDYELFKTKRGAFLPLLQAQLSSLSMLFLGLSFTDPNVRHVLSLIREAFIEAPPEHFAIVRPPQREDFDSDDAFSARLTQHRLWSTDLRRYGLRAIEVASYTEVPGLLRDLERQLARHRVWVCGSWPVGPEGGRHGEFNYQLAYGLGQELGRLGLTLVNGSGLLIGSAVVAGFLSALQAGGGWDLDRRLIARPFPQPLAGHEADRAQWAMLRAELGRLSGVVVFIGGQKLVDDAPTDADGVYAEYRAAEDNEAFVLPIGATGGTARAIAEGLLADPAKLNPTRAPSDEELRALLDPGKSASELIRLATDILRRATR